MSTANSSTRPTKAGTSVTFESHWQERDDSYPSTANRRKALYKDVFMKETWVLEGEDREAGFVFALRNLYRTVPFPEVEMYQLGDRLEVVGEITTNCKQLIGLPEYGARTQDRDPDTFELITGRAIEQPDRRRIRTRQVLFNQLIPIFEAKGPVQLCKALRDAICGLRNAFRMGYVQREISPQYVYIVPGVGNAPETAFSNPAYMLSKDGKSTEGLPRHYWGFIGDFTVCQNLNGEDDKYVGDTEALETTPSTPTSLFAAEKRSDFTHSPIYDLDSFLWLLLYVSTDIICDYMAGRRKVKLGDPHFTIAMAQAGKAASELAEKSLAVDLSSSASKATEAGKNSETVAEEDTGKSTGLEMIGEEPMAIVSEGDATAQSGTQAADAAGMPMDVDDVDDDKAGTKRKTTVEDVTIEEDAAQPLPENEEEKKHKGDDETDAAERSKTKGKTKVTVESDHEYDEAYTEKQRKEKGKENASAENDERDDFDPTKYFSLGPTEETWYYHPLSRYHVINVLKPIEYPAPKDFKPPPKAQYVAFADDKMAHVIHSLLSPREMFKFTNRPTRGHLIGKLEDFVADSHGLAPFRPLVKALSELGYRYYTREADLKTRTFSKEEVEEAFDLYLDAFEKHMPKPEEDNWYYLKFYEGSDILCKFEDKFEFLGAFTSPDTIYKPC